MLTNHAKAGHAKTGYVLLNSPPPSPRLRLSPRLREITTLAHRKQNLRETRLRLRQSRRFNASPSRARRPGRPSPPAQRYAPPLLLQRHRLFWKRRLQAFPVRKLVPWRREERKKEKKGRKEIVLTAFPAVFLFKPQTATRSSLVELSAFLQMSKLRPKGIK